MEDCWLDQEEFNFDIPLSPLLGDDAETGKPENKSETADDIEEGEDEVFFGPVGHFERCAAVVAKKDVVEPLQPLEPQEQALLLAESASLSVILKHKPLGTVLANSPVAVVFPFKRESPAIDIEQLRSYRERVASKEKLNSSSSSEENKENQSAKKTEEEHVQSSKENSTVKQKSPCKDLVINRRAFSKTSTSPNQALKTTPLVGDTKERGIPSPKKINLNSSLQKRGCSSEEKKIQGSKIAVPKASAIPRVASKIARPSSIPAFKGIPTLKPGLLAGQAKLRATSATESKLKPMKVTHMQPRNAPRDDAGNTQMNKGTSEKPKISGRKSLSSSLIGTPGRKSEVHRNLNNTGDMEMRRKSAALSSSSSKLQFSKPNHNSTPNPPAAAQNSTSRRSICSDNSSRRITASSNFTPVKNKVDSTIPKAAGTPSNRPSSSRRSLVPKQLNSTQDNSPVTTKTGPRRTSLLRYPRNNNHNTTSPVSKQKKSLLSNSNNPTSPVSKQQKLLLSNSNIKRSGTFVLGEAAKKVETPSLIDVDVTKSVTQETKTEIPDVNMIATTEGLFSPTVTISDDKDPQLEPLKLSQMLLPEVSAVKNSPLLKFESPMADNVIVDPFATGNTPPAPPVSDGVLAPEPVVEPNLIQL